MTSTAGPAPDPQTGTPPGKRSSVLMLLAAGQFLMTLDSSVMNVSIQSVANDLHTTVTGIQTAITLYTLVMAAFMITGGKIGAIIGRRKAFGIGLVVYGCGSFVTAISPNLTVLIFGWSLLEGLGAALILPAIVALVAGNVAKEGRSAAYGLIAAAGAIAVAAGPLIGGAVTTFASWRWVFAGEVVIVVVILRVPAHGSTTRRPRSASRSTTSAPCCRSSASASPCTASCGPAPGAGCARSRTHRSSPASPWCSGWCSPGCC